MVILYFVKKVLAISSSILHAYYTKYPCKYHIDAESSQCMLGMKNVRSPAFYEYNGSVVCTNIRFAGLQEHDVHSTIRAPLHTVCMPEIIVQLFRDICNSVLIEFMDL